MARITVYIPDDLLERAKVAFGDPEVKTSQLVQRGLEGLLRPTAPAYAIPPPDEVQRMSNALIALLATAESEYQRGWVAALDRLPDLPLWFIEEMGNRNFAIRQWAASYKREWRHETDGPPLAGFAGKIAQDLGRLVDPVGFDQFAHKPTDAYMDGYEDALRAAWSEFTSNVNEPFDEGGSES